MSAKITLPQFRISNAALGRRLASTILKAREAHLSPEEFQNLLNAVLDNCISETPVPENLAEDEILISERAEIEKSVRRSIAAKRAAERRHLQREQSAVEQVQTFIQGQDTETEIKSALPEASDPATETAPTSGNGRKRRRRNRRRHKK